ncbi:hypothetical protein JXL21_01760 [Candidatus Bathyarchaeota archaeon]|nr:hypothetical protein [Candidatus Bathyarchaeota archaeon]
MSLSSPKLFYEQYKDDAEAARKQAFLIGREIGQSLIEKQGIREKNLEALASILNEFQRMVQGEPNARVEGETLTMRCKGFCPIMRAALTLNIPWQWLDYNYALPMFHGMASLIVPGMTIKLLSAKSKGDPECLYLFEA